MQLGDVPAAHHRHAYEGVQQAAATTHYSTGVTHTTLLRSAPASAIRSRQSCARYAMHHSVHHQPQQSTFPPLYCAAHVPTTVARVSCAAKKDRLHVCPSALSATPTGPYQEASHKMHSPTKLFCPPYATHIACNCQSLHGHTHSTNNRHRACTQHSPEGWFDKSRWCNTPVARLCCPGMVEATCCIHNSRLYAAQAPSSNNDANKFQAPCVGAAAFTVTPNERRTQPCCC